MNLAFKSHKISGEFSQQWSKSEKQKTNDFFGGQNVTSNVRTTAF